MLRLIGLMISIGLADSLNPTTIAPALYLATNEKSPRKQVAEFTLAVFAVYLGGGLAIALGPGELVLALVPRPSKHLGYVLEIVAGVAMLTASAFLWGYREHLAQRPPPEVKADGRSSAILGATITAVELPTAFPYFAAIAAVVGSGLGVVRQMVLIVLFNVCFIAPLLGIVATLTFAGPNATRVLARGREFLERRWPTVLAVLALAAGVFVTLLGITGVASSHHNDFGSFSRRLRGLFHH
jgi:cytochrome c biogenesis protein CcdA